MDNSTQYDHEILVRYLDNELEAGEKETVEKRLSSEATLQQELENLKLAREAIRQYGLRQEVASIRGTMIREVNVTGKKIAPVRKMLRYSLAIAAAILLLVGIFMVYNFFTLSPEKIYSSRYQPFDLSTVRGSGDELPIVKAYRENDYDKVISIHTKKEDSSVMATFLAAMANLRKNNMNDAIPDLEEVVNANKNSSSPVFKDEAEYYLAIAYVRNRDFDLALPILERIRDDEEHLYHEKVDRKLIRNVKMLKWR